MSTPIGNSGIAPVLTPFISNDTLLSDVANIRQNGASALQAGLTELGKVAGNGIAKFSAIMDLPSLAAPKSNSSMADISLRIGLLQDALNQLMTEVSKLGLTQKMNEANAKNLEELDKMNEAIRKNAEAAEKAKEAEKKGNVIDAISNWVQAAVSIVSAVINVISAIAQAAAAVVTLGGYGYGLVAAGALITSAVALGVAAGGQIALAIDSTMKACGGSGYLSDTQRADCAKVIEVAGYVAMAAGMIGLVGGIASSLTNAAGQVGGALGREGTKQGVAAMVKEAAVAAAQNLKAAAAKFLDAPVATLKAAMQSLIDSMKASLSKIFSGAKEGLDDAAAAAKTAIEKAGQEAAKGASQTAAKEAAEVTALKYALKAVDKLDDVAITASKKGMAEAVESGFQEATKQAVKQGIEKGSPEFAKLASNEIFKAAFTEGMKSMSTAISRAAITSGLGQAANQGATYAGKLEKAELEGEAASLRFDSSKAEADAKAITAQIARLMQLIEMMQKQLSEQMDQGQQTLATIFQGVSSAQHTLSAVQVQC